MINKLIKKWEEKHSDLLTEYQNKSTDEKNYNYLPVLRREMKNVLDFINDLKPINLSVVDVTNSALLAKIEDLEKTNKYLNFILDNGLGEDDLKNDITLPQEI